MLTGHRQKAGTSEKWRCNLIGSRWKEQVLTRIERRIDTEKPRAEALMKACQWSVTGWRGFVCLKLVACFSSGLMARELKDEDEE
jgi:hypothetical protein